MRFAVGAVDSGADGAGQILEPFSSQGPTIDGRIKPDIASFDGVSSYLSDFNTGFYGTSASAPHAAGAAALALAAHPALTADQLASYLTNIANNGVPLTPNNQQGTGLVSLLALNKVGSGLRPLDRSGPQRCADGAGSCHERRLGGRRPDGRGRTARPDVSRCNYGPATLAAATSVMSTASFSIPAGLVPGPHVMTLTYTATGSWIAPTALTRNLTVPNIPGWFGYESLTTGVTSSPGVSSWSPGRLDVFWAGSTGALTHEFYNWGWAGPENLPGQWIGQPSAVSWSFNRIDVFGQGPGSTLQHSWWDGVRWNGPEVLATGVASTPTVTTWGVERLDVFYLDSAGHLSTTYYNGKWWTVPNIGGTWSSAPSAVAWSPGRIDVFGEGAGGTLQHLWYQGGWAGPETLAPAGGLSAAPSVASWQPGRLDVFWVSSSGQLKQDFYLGGWFGPINFGGQLVGSPAAIAWGPGRLDVFGRGSDNSLRHLWYQ